MFAHEEQEQNHCQAGNIGLALDVTLQWLKEKTGLCHIDIEIGLAALFFFVHLCNGGNGRYGSHLFALLEDL